DRATTMRSFDLLSKRQLLYGQPGEDRTRELVGDRPGRIRSHVFLFEQEPLVSGLSLRELHEGPASAQLHSAKLHVQLAVLYLLLGRALDVGHHSAVPSDHRAGAVLPLGDDVLELEVLDGVVLRLHGKDLLRRVQARALRYGKAPEDAADLEAYVVMTSCCIV